MSELEYTLVEFCSLAHVDEALVSELVEHGIIEPVVRSDRWLFPAEALSRCVRAERMRRDLELNYHGVALALELIERNRRLHQKVDYLQRLVERLGD